MKRRRIAPITPASVNGRGGLHSGNKWRIIESIMERFLKSKRYLTCATALAIVTIIFVTVYAAVQGNERQSANDPQIQIAEDAAASLDSGGSFQSVILPTRVDIAKSLAVFTAVFDGSGKPLGSSGYLNNELPTLPQGVFDYVRTHGEDRFTWEPAQGVRDAVVVTKFSGGFVMAGRSIREVEKRESALLAKVFVAWAASVFIIGSYFFILEKKRL